MIIALTLTSTLCVVLLVLYLNQVAKTWVEIADREHYQFQLARSEEWVKILIDLNKKSVEDIKALNTQLSQFHEPENLPAV